MRIRGAAVYRWAREHSSCFRDVPMSAHLDPIAQVTQRATDALVRELGVVDTIRFLGQFRAGSGDYTAQRQALFQDATVQELAAQIKARRAAAGT